MGLGGVTSWMAAPDGRLWRDESGGGRAGRLGLRRRAGRDHRRPAGPRRHPEQTAVWAAYLHGRAGERLASTVGSLGFLARELPREVPRRTRRDHRLTDGCAPGAFVLRCRRGGQLHRGTGLRGPKIDSEAFVAPTAVVVGAVTMGPRASIWYAAVARADSETIEIGEDSNVQDGCTLHSDPGFPLVLGEGVTVGHRVVLHGARVDDDVLVGMGSVVMNGAHIGSGSIVAAGAVVTPGTVVPPSSVVAGVPAKVVRQATDDDLAHIRANAASYYDRLASARKVRPVVRRPLPPAGYLPDDGMP